MTGKETNKTEQKKENKEFIVENDGIWSDIDDDSISEMLKYGRIYPSLKARLNAVYEVKVVSTPKSFDSKEFGIAHSIDVIHENMRKSIVLAKSFRQQLKAEMIRGKLTSDGKPDFKKLLGKKLTFQKALGNTKTMNDVPLYSVQID